MSASVLLTVPGINVSAQQFVCEPEIISETVADDGETGAGDGETGNQMETVDDTEDNNVPESNTETESGDVLKSSEETRESESIEDTEEGSDIAPLSVDVAVGSTAEENGLNLHSDKSGCRVHAWYGSGLGRNTGFRECYHTGHSGN